MDFFSWVCTCKANKYPSRDHGAAEQLRFHTYSHKGQYHQTNIAAKVWRDYSNSPSSVFLWLGKKKYFSQLKERRSSNFSILK